MAISREIGHRQDEGNRLGNLGLAYRALGQNVTARKYLQDALNILEEIKSPNVDFFRAQFDKIQNHKPDVLQNGQLVCPRCKQKNEKGSTFCKYCKRAFEI